MVVIGVTGGIASGKSLVAQQLGQLGAEVLEADRIGHAVLQDPEVRAALGARWGTGILDAAGEVRRGVVAEKVFAPPPDGPRELAFLEQWTHPRIAADAFCDIIIFVDADCATRGVRARQRGWSDEQLLAREAAQPALALQRARADVVLDSSGTRERLIAQVEKFWQSLRTDARTTIFPERPFTNGPESP
jgi:dephospho-CoA kinase